MPTYEYGCKFCEHRFDRYQNISEPVLRKCPECGRRGLQRLFSPGAGFVFKGSGFHQTDYRSANYKSAAQSDQDGGKGDCSGTDPCKGCPAKPKGDE